VQPDFGVPQICQAAAEVATVASTRTHPAASSFLARTDSRPSLVFTPIGTPASPNLVPRARARSTCAAPGPGERTQLGIHPLQLGQRRIKDLYRRHRTFVDRGGDLSRVHLRVLNVVEDVHLSYHHECYEQ
jgi:hypothetical protein